MLDYFVTLNAFKCFKNILQKGQGGTLTNVLVIVSKYLKSYCFRKDYRPHNQKNFQDFKLSAAVQQSIILFITSFNIPTFSTLRHTFLNKIVSIDKLFIDQKKNKIIQNFLSSYCTIDQKFIVQNTFWKRKD